MKFIPGSTFVNTTIKNTRYFKRNVVYKLHNIAPVSDNCVEYVFSLPDRTLHTVKFESVKQADEYLQTIQR